MKLFYNIRFLISSFSALAFALSANAFDFESGGFFYNILDSDNEVEITSGNPDGSSYSGIIHIPASVAFNGKSYRVSAIGESAFANSSITDIDIPNSVTSIGNKAFCFAEKLENISLPTGISSISANMLEGTAIYNIAIPEGVSVIKSGAFQTCRNLSTVFLPSSLSKIEAYGFNNCQNLREIYCAATTPVNASAWAIFIGLDDIDLIIPRSAQDKYKQASPWNDSSIFNIYPDEPVGVSMLITGKQHDDDWDILSLGNNIAFKIFDGDNLIALTAADSYFLPRCELDKTYTIVPTNYFDDGDPVSYTVRGWAAIDNVPEDVCPIKVFARNGIIYISGDTYGMSVRVFDAYGNLWRAQDVTRGEIEGLERGKVYIVVCGNYVTKLWL